MIRSLPAHIQVQSVFAAIVIAVAVIAAASPARSAERVNLITPIVVTGPEITLGDLFELDTPLADIVVAGAPAPGESRLLYPSFVQRLAAKHGMSWSNPERLKRVRVDRPGKRVPTSELLALIGDDLKDQMAVAAVDVQLSNSRFTISVPVDAAEPVAIEDVVFDRRTGRFEAQLRLASDAPDGRLVTVSGRAAALVPVPVPARPIARDEVITADAVRWIEMRADRVPANALTDETQIVGQQARRALRADAVVRATDMRAPIVVAKGEVITMSFAIPGVELTDRGRALENGGQDQIIRIVNLTSNRTISAQVAGPGLVRVAGSLGAMR